MPAAAVSSQACDGSGIFLVSALVLPLVGILLTFLAGGKYARGITLVLLVAGLGVAAGIAEGIWPTGQALTYLPGGWLPPLGIKLRADGLSAVMIAVTAFVIFAVGLYAPPEFRIARGKTETRKSFSFWILLLAIWLAMNAIFLGNDLFNLYVALELLTFAAVPLVSLSGAAGTLKAALRYLLFVLIGSVLYLLGTALLYGAYGTLDVGLLSQRVHTEPATLVAAALMTVGLLAKTALFPLYLWLPPAHAGAPSTASAVLSALVVKGSFFIVVRLWFGVMPGVVTLPSAQLLASLGAAAILFGSVLALRQERLKLLIAYSTLAQIGYLFLMFPLAFDARSAQLQTGSALTGGLLQTISHATAKASMFMAAGLIYAALGHDRIAALRGIARVMPISVLAFALGGVALMGLPPSGAYVAKKLLLDAAAKTGEWWWDLVIQAGGFFTTSYVLLVLAHALWPADGHVKLRAPVSRLQETAALVLALCSMLLGLAALGPVPLGSLSLAPKELLSAIVLVLGGGVLAWGFGHGLPRVAVGDVVIAIMSPVRIVAVAVAAVTERADNVLRRWPAAGLSLLVLVVMFVWAMLS